MTFPWAFIMGFSVASMPGPILALVTAETLRRGAGAGLLILTAPPLIDACVMLPLALMLHASLLSGRGAVVLGMVGCLLLFWLGLQSIRSGRTEVDIESNSGSGWSWSRKELPSFLKGVLTHLANPYPYIYWVTVGVSFIRRGLEGGGVWGAAVFPLGFWVGASAFNLVIVFLAVRGRRMLPPRWEPFIHWFSGLLLMGSGLFLAVMVWREFV